MKDYRLYVTNMDQSLNVLNDLDIEAKIVGPAILFSVPEEQKMDVIIQLNQERIVVYDIEEVS